MSENTVEQIGFGYVDDTSDDLKTKSGGKFGLNQGVFLTKFELNQNAGKDDSAQDALDYTIQVEDKEFMTRIYPTDKVFDKNNNEITDKSSDEYKRAYNADWKQKNAVIIHILKCFKSDDEVRQALNKPFGSFGEFIQACAGLLPQNFNSIPLDVFLEYQWQPSDGQDRTFLQLPKNMKGGYFLVPFQAPKSGQWTEIKDDKGLRYQDAQGNTHPFERDAAYMESPKANRIVEGEESGNAALQQGAKAGTGAAKKGTW